MGEWSVRVWQAIFRWHMDVLFGVSLQLDIRLLWRGEMTSFLGDGRVYRATDV